MDKKPQTVLCFGVFDLLHDGHRYFLHEAKKLGGKLVVAVAPDTVVEALKGSPPRNFLKRRLENLTIENLADVVTAGDAALGNWDIIARHAPDIIALGYDQKELVKALGDFLRKNRRPVRLVHIEPYADGALHSSLIRKKK